MSVVDKASTPTSKNTVLNKRPKATPDYLTYGTLLFKGTSRPMVSKPCAVPSHMEFYSRDPTRRGKEEKYKFMQTNSSPS